MEELLARLKTRLRYSGTVEDAILQDHLTSAIDTVNELRQFTPTDEEIVESQYKSIVVELALCAYSKMGAEGQTMHNENGVSRVYEGALYPHSLLSKIIPRPRGIV